MPEAGEWLELSEWMANAAKVHSRAPIAKSELLGCVRYGYSFLELRHGWGITAKTSRLGFFP